MRCRSATLICTLVLLAPGASLADENTELGAELYAESCATCHGDDLSGLAAYRGDLNDLTLRLEGGTEQMPDFTGFFYPDEIAAIYSFMRDRLQID